MATLVAGTLLLPGSSADAALTTGKCLAQKSKAWGNLRKCQATARAKILEGKVGDLTKCQTAFQGVLTKIGAKATKAAIACRYGANGDGTVTDYDTGLQWEQKTDNDITCILAFPNCWTNTYVWNDAMAKFLSEMNGTTDSALSQAGYAGYTDWRLPTVGELQTILLAPFDCGTSPCIDPIFGLTVVGFYWSATNNGFVNDGFKTDNLYVRAVRAGL
jgi:hypothetical protein